MATDYKTLMVDAGLDAAAEPRLRLAAALASRFGAHLLGIASCAARPPVSGPFGETALLTQLIEAEVERVQAALAAAADRFRAAAGAAQLSTEWRAFAEYPGNVLAREARAADLLVIGRGDGAGIHLSAAPGDVLMRAGRPVLVVPPQVAAVEARRVLVAWKEAREARRAVADALPFLVRAEQVVILGICEDKGMQPQAQRQVEDVAASLSRHGVQASAEVQAQHGRTVSEALLGRAGELGADLVVSGGYGHARPLEWVFGGVTRDLLARAPVCCLLSH